jgi:hypothetical protein
MTTENTKGIRTWLVCDSGGQAAVIHADFFGESKSGNTNFFIKDPGWGISTLVASFYHPISVTPQADDR